MTWRKEDSEIIEKYYKISSKEEICAMLPHKNWRSIVHKAHRMNCSKWTRMRYSLEDNFFSVPCEINSYWAGFLAADGNILKDRAFIRLLVSKKDKNVIEKFKSDVKFTGGIKQTRRRNKKGKLQEYVGVGITSSQWKHDLGKNFNIVPAKSKILEPPLLDDDILKDCFLIGFIDGDGSIYYQKNKKGIRNRLVFSISGTRKMMEWVRERIEFLSGHTFLGKYGNISYIKKTDVYKFTCSCKIAYTALCNLQNYSIPKMKRKWDNIEKYKTFNFSLPKNKISKTEAQKVCDLFFKKKNSISQIARIYKVSFNVVRRIIFGEVYDDITNASKLVEKTKEILSNNRNSRFGIKLTEEDALVIIDLFLNQKLSMNKISQMFDVKPKLIRDILRGVRYNNTTNMINKQREVNECISIIRSSAQINRQTL